MYHFYILRGFIFINKSLDLYGNSWNLLPIFYHNYLITLSLLFASGNSDNSLPPEYSQDSLHIHSVWPGSILLTDQLQVLILISFKMIMDSAKTVRWILSFQKFSMLRVNMYCYIGTFSAFILHCLTAICSCLYSSFFIETFFLKKRQCLCTFAYNYLINNFMSGISADIHLLIYV